MFINDVGAEHVGGDRRRHRRRELRLADHRRARRPIRDSGARATPTTTPTGVCAITGGAFYAPLTAQFPSDYSNDYFFADYCGGWIRKLDPVGRQRVTTFATGISSPVDLKVSDDGSLYYLARGRGTRRIGSTTARRAPSITTHPASRTVRPGASVTFSVRASGPAPLRYQWQRNGANIAGATAQDYTIASVAAATTARASAPSSPTISAASRATRRC